MKPPIREKGPTLFAKEVASAELQLATLDEAAIAVGKTTSNIRDYIQRGRIAKYDPTGRRIKRARNGELRVSLTEIRAFLSLVEQGLEKHHDSTLCADLGFYDVPEHKRTKHVHRLHPYLGKFIPQLVEWFLSRYFGRGDTILDPFVGSGTTLVQANEMGIHAIGIDVSPFNCHIARVKTHRYDVQRAISEIRQIRDRVREFSSELDSGQQETGTLFRTKTGWDLARSLISTCESEYLHKWFAPRCLAEMLYYRSLIPEYEYAGLLQVLLSRAVRSSRLVPHYDLATPKAPLPVGKEYWCRKHNRYCMPIDNCIVKINAYSEDTGRRIAEFDRLRDQSAKSLVIEADSRTVNLPLELRRNGFPPDGIDGIFTSPPYVGQIDYHDQHVYSYELFGFPRNDNLEIGPKRRGKSRLAQLEYIENIAAVLSNVKRVLKRNARIFIVANDKFGLYPEIARRSGLQICNEYKRAVTKRTEQGDDPYQESVFELKKVS